MDARENTLLHMMVFHIKQRPSQWEAEIERLKRQVEMSDVLREGIEIIQRYLRALKNQAGDLSFAPDQVYRIAKYDGKQGTTERAVIAIFHSVAVGR